MAETIPVKGATISVSTLSVATSTIGSPSSTQPACHGGLVDALAEVGQDELHCDVRRSYVVMSRAARTMLSVSMLW